MMKSVQNFFITFVALVILGLFCLMNPYIQIFFKKYSQPAMKRAGMIVNVPPKFNSKPKMVLLYTPLWGKLPWPGVKTNQYFTDRRGKLCPISNCVLTFDKKDLPKSDAVIFHARDIPSVETMKTISLNKNRLNQRWIYYSHENPYFVNHDVSEYNNFFNWTMTYRYESDIFVPYRKFREFNAEEAKKVQTDVNYATGKDKLVAWAVNHCGRIRDKLVQKLLEYTKITIFGKCGKKFNQWNVCKRGSRKCDVLLQTFKFYLSFENSMCLDYVTEKYWYTPFEHKMVPIVLGSNYNRRVAIPGSYIDMLDFPSVQAFASYLEYLDKNDTAYNEYFKWKEKYTFHDEYSADCDICAKLHNNSLPVKVYKNLDYFWGAHTCDRRAEAIKKLLRN